MLMSEHERTRDGRSRLASTMRRLRELVAALNDADARAIAEVVAGLSRSQRLLAPLALAVGGIEMLLQGVKVLISNWRLLPLQLLPVALTWLAMYDLKAHLLSRSSDRTLSGPLLIAIGLAIVAVTAAAFFMNAVFAFAVTQSGPPELRPAFEQARSRLWVILGSGAVIGVLLAVAITVMSREQRPWFVLTLGVATGVLMFCLVAIPARLAGTRPKASRRDKLTASVVAGIVGFAVVAPPYLVGRAGVLMLGVRVLFIPGLVLVSVSVALEAGAIVAIKTVKLTSKLTGATREADAA
jgi:uncharacterized membrane protein